MQLPNTRLFEQCIAPDNGGLGLEAAIKAMTDFDKGSRTGDWQPFLNRLTDDVSLIVPAPGFAEKGLMNGKTAARDIFAYHDGVAGLAWSVRTIMAVGNEVSFEATVRNEGGESPISLMLLLVFVMRQDSISQLREYAVYTGEEGHGWKGDTTVDDVFSYRPS